MKERINEQPINHMRGLGTLQSRSLTFKLFDSNQRGAESSKQAHNSTGKWPISFAGTYIIRPRNCPKSGRGPPFTLINQKQLPLTTPAIGSSIFNPVTQHCAQQREGSRVEDHLGTEVQLLGDDWSICPCFILRLNSIVENTCIALNSVTFF